MDSPLFMPDNALSKQGGARVRIPPPLVDVAFVLLGLGMQYLVTPLRFPVARWATITLGAIIVGLGALLIGTAFSLFRASGQDPRPWLPSPSLVFQGPYRFTRNPMYVGMALAQIGLGVALDNLWIVLLAPVSLAVIHFLAVKPEEAYLAEKFGEPYRQYLARVRRYL